MVLLHPGEVTDAKLGAHLVALLFDDGRTIGFPDLDEYVSVAGLLGYPDYPTIGIHLVARMRSADSGVDADVQARGLPAQDRHRAW